MQGGLRTQILDYWAETDPIPEKQRPSRPRAAELQGTVTYRSGVIWPFGPIYLTV